MRKVAPFVWAIFMTVVVGIGVNLASDEVKLWIAQTHLQLLLLLTAIASGLAGLWAYRASIRKALEDEFDLFTSSDRLRPEDMGFKPMFLGEHVSDSRRPHYPIYIPREAVPYAQRLEERPTTVFRERDLVAMLSEGESLLLIGMPTEGKSRTLFEMVRCLQGCLVVRPRRDKLPTERAIALVANRHVVCLLDDINSFAGAAVQLIDFHRMLARSAARMSIAGACRDGPELQVTVGNRGSSLFQVFESIRHRLALRAPTDHDRDRLRTHIGELGDPQATTLGSVCMAGAYALMVERLHQLDRSAQDVHHAMQLLAAANVEPMIHQRIRKVVEIVFGRALQPAQVRDALTLLASNGFLLSAGDADPVVAEAAYLRGPASSTFYLAGRSAPADIESLVEPLQSLCDEDALAQVAWSLGQLKRYSSAGACYDSLIAVCQGPNASDSPTNLLFAMFNKATNHAEQGQQADELRTYDQIEERFGSDPRMGIHYVTCRALLNKAARLCDVGAPAQALVCIDRALERANRANLPLLDDVIARAWVAKAQTLGELGLHDEELSAADQLPTRFGSHTEPDVLESVAIGLLNKALRLRRLDRSPECIAAYEHVERLFATSNWPKLRVRAAEATWSKGRRLEALGRTDEASTTYLGLIARMADAGELELAEWTAQAKSRLAQMAGTGDEAVHKYEEAATCAARIDSAGMRKIGAEALYNRAVQLRDLGRTGEAIAAYQLVAERYGAAHEPAVRHVVALALRNQGLQLEASGDLNAAETAFRAVVARMNTADTDEICEQCARGCINLAMVLLQLRRFGEMANPLTQCQERFSASAAMPVRHQAVIATLIQGRLLALAESPELALAAYDSALRAMPGYIEPLFYETAFKVLRNKSFVLGTLGRHEERQRVLEELETQIASWGDENTFDRRVQLLVARGKAASDFGDEAEEKKWRHKLVEEIQRSGCDPEEVMDRATHAIENGL